MKTVWTSGMDSKKSDELASDFKASYQVRSRLTEIVEGKIMSIRNDNLSRNKYDSPSWAFLQADSVGYERALQEIISLLAE